MMVMFLGLIFLGIILNLVFYEYRVIKNERGNPREINLTGYRKL